jgi:hypothetical protein
MFWMYSFKLRKVVRLSDPCHFDHNLPFLCPEDFISALTSLPMTSARCTSRMATSCNACRSVRERAFALQLRGSQSLSLLTADSGENSGELDAGEPDAAEQDKESPCAAQHKVLLGPKDFKRLKHGKDLPFDAELQYLKPQLLAQALSYIINS